MEDWYIRSGYIKIYASDGATYVIAIPAITCVGRGKIWLTDGQFISITEDAETEIQKLMMEDDHDE